MREGHLLVLSPDTQAYVDLATFLAFQHIQHRTLGGVLPEIQHRIQDCDFHWTYHHQQDVTPSSLLQATQGTSQPFAVLGTQPSERVAETLSILTSATDLPLITSSIPSLPSLVADEPVGVQTLLAQTMPTSQGEAHALMAYLHFQLKVPQVGVLFVQSNWGRRYQQYLMQYATQYNIKLHSVSYSHTDDRHLDSTMRQIQQTPVRYWIGILDPNHWRPLVTHANQWGLLGSNQSSANHTYQWFLTDVVDQLIRETKQEPAMIAQALHGVGMIRWKLKPHPAFDRAMANAANDIHFQKAFVDTHPTLDNFTSLFNHNYYYNSTSYYRPKLLQYLTYDAVILLGLTACETPGRFTGPEFYKSLLQRNFTGVSGQLRLDPVTGSRVLIDTDLEYEIVNLLLTQNDPITTVLETTTSATIVLSTDSTHENKIANHTILVHIPFVFADNTTNPPLALPTVEHKMNLIPTGLQAFGIALALYVMLLSIFCAYSTIELRDKYVIRAAQPGFLISLCLGTFIMASTIILLSLQEDLSQQTLDRGCGMIPWTLCIGFIIAMSSLFSKTRRINKIMHQMGSSKRTFCRANSFRPVRIEPSDVIWPAFILCHINVGILLAWTWSPFRLTWQRTFVDNYDSLGRQIESFGACRPDDGTNWYLVFVVPLCCTNLLVLMRATYASYRGRRLPTEFQETKYLSVALVTLSETILVGALPSFAIANDPTSFYLLSTFAIVSACLAILLPVFLPKYWAIREEEISSSARTDVLPHVRSERGHDEGRHPETLSDGGRVLLASTISKCSGTFRSTPDSGIASFLASQPVAIRRTGSNGTIGTNGTDTTSAATASETPTALPVCFAAFDRRTKEPATVTKAILLSQEGPLQEPPPPNEIAALDTVLQELKASRASNGAAF